MITHIDIANKIIYFLDELYYKNLLKVYSIIKTNEYTINQVKEETSNLYNHTNNNNTNQYDNQYDHQYDHQQQNNNYNKKSNNNSLKHDLNSIFQTSRLPIFKPDYFVFQQYYMIYSFLYHLSYKHTLRYSLSLHFFHIFGLIYEQLLIKYNYKPLYNISYLKDTVYLLFVYLFFMKLLLMNIGEFKRTILLSTFSVFYSLVNVNEIYKERLKSIENEQSFNHPFKILIVTPNKDTIKKIIQKTKIFTMNNFLLCINLFLYMFL